MPEPAQVRRMDSTTPECTDLPPPGHHMDWLVPEPERELHMDWLVPELPPGLHMDWLVPERELHMEWLVPEREHGTDWPVGVVYIDTAPYRDWAQLLGCTLRIPTTAPPRPRRPGPPQWRARR
jgi:hypothetical protein